MREVRIVLVGERNVGKSTLILGLVSEEFSTKVPIKTEEITIPADVNQEKVPSRIVDTSSREQSEQQIREEIRLANVIIVVYAVNDPISIKMVSERWLPLIRECNPSNQFVDRKPVVLAGNKSDLSENSTLDQILSIMNNYPEIETCIECSVKNMQNVSEMFWYAQKAVLYPTAPLFIAEKKDLTDVARKALTRIFRICDMDNDGFLSDKELEAFQRRCFQIPLSSQSLEDIKYMVGKNTTDGITANGLTLKGFLFLNSMFIRKGRHETTWAVLRCFGYDNRLRLSKDYISPQLSIPPGCTTELTSQSMQYLKMMFKKYDEDADGCLSPRELLNLFVTAPQLPWDERVHNSAHCNNLGYLTLEGFIAQWVLMTYFSPSTTLEYLAYLGFTYEYGLGSTVNANNNTSNNSSTNSSAAGHLLNMSSRYVRQRHQQASVAMENMLQSSTLSYSPTHSISSSSMHSSSQLHDDLDEYGGDKTSNYPFWRQTHSDDPISSGGRGGGEGGEYTTAAGTSSGNHSINSATTTSRSSIWSGHQQWLVQTALTITREKRMDLHKKQTQRNVFYCRVYGSSKVGKTCFLQGLLGHSLSYVASLRREEIPQFTCATVNVYGDIKYLILHEIDDAWGVQMPEHEALQCDVAALLYDVTDPHSFKYVADLYLNYYKACHRRVPCIFIACKAEQMEVTQYYPLEPAEFCSKHRVPLGDPLKFSCVNAPMNSSAAAAAAAASHNSTSATSQQHHHHSSGSRHIGNNKNGSGVNTSMKDNGSFPSQEFIGTALTRHEIYQQIATLANYPHLRGLQLSHGDFAWKLTLAATVLAGFGFVAFKMARTHL